MRFSFLLSLILLMGCVTTAQYELTAPGTLPEIMPDWQITGSDFIGELNRTYDQGIAYERAKIKYLLGHTSQSDWQFDRNGMVYDGKATAKHLRRKYRRQITEVTSARIFIEHIASASSQSRREYYALPGDGKAYRTGDVLKYELERLETFMDHKQLS